MNFNIVSINAADTRSLCWHEDYLVDWIAGGRQYFLNGATKASNVYYTYRFDAAVMSPSGRYAVIYERFGTKGLLLDHGKEIREINRSYYCANAYEFPVTLFELSDGREVMAHCPGEYNKIEIEDLATGELLTARTSKTADFFHSRLAVNSNSKYLMSAGWAWHPFSTVFIWGIDSVLTNPPLLDEYTQDLLDDHGVEIQNACFYGSDLLIMSTHSDALAFYHNVNFDDLHRRPGTLATFDLSSRQYNSVASLRRDTGKIMNIGETHVVAFLNHPSLIETATGQIVHEWTEIYSGRQRDSFNLDEPLPHVALDPVHQRFAVANEASITVVTIQL